MIVIWLLKFKYKTFYITLHPFGRGEITGDNVVGLSRLLIAAYPHPKD